MDASVRSTGRPRARLAPRETHPSSTPTASSSDGLVKRWGTTTALAGATFDIGPGVTGLLGANGAGKTTLLGHGPRPAPARRGHASGARPRPRRRPGPRCGPASATRPSTTCCPPDMRAHDLVRHIAEIHGLPRRDATARASDALCQVGLGEERFRPVGTMSTGQRQRVKLAQAIAHDPRSGAARRAHRRPRPGAARRHARPHPPRRHRVRHRRRAVVAPARRGRAGVRRRRHPRRTARSPPPAASTSCTGDRRLVVELVDRLGRRHARLAAAGSVAVDGAASCARRADAARRRHRPSTTSCATPWRPRASAPQPRRDAADPGRHLPGGRPVTDPRGTAVRRRRHPADGRRHAAELGRAARVEPPASSTAATAPTTGRASAHAAPCAASSPDRPAGAGHPPAGVGQDPADPVDRHRLRAGHRVHRHHRRSSRTRRAAPSATAAASRPTASTTASSPSALIVFVAFVAPEALCTDRRNRHARPVPGVAADPHDLPAVEGGRRRHRAVVRHARPAAADDDRLRPERPRPRRDRRLPRARRAGHRRRRWRSRCCRRCCRSPSRAPPTRKWAATAATIVILLGTGVVSDSSSRRATRRATLLLRPAADAVRAGAAHLRRPGATSRRYARDVVDADAGRGLPRAGPSLLRRFVWWRYQRIEVTR